MKLGINTSQSIGRIKPMNGVNNGPFYTSNKTMNATNLPEFRQANIPYVRTHDSSMDYNYGGEHTVDVSAVFPDFGADPYDEASYDFTLTDGYIENTVKAGSRIFYRLGNKIEHWSKHYGVMPPADPEKWAVICEHIIRHLNEGWADGHHFGIEYFEIWNEPDLYPKCWLGTPEDYYRLYEVTSKHLKDRFPDIKIGGPAVCDFNEAWLRPFFGMIRDKKLPFDFYTWHRYTSDVATVVSRAKKHRELLDEFGFYNVESILDEWNYAISFSGEELVRTLKTIRGVKGAAFAAAVMCACQHEPVDMLLYYDARTNCPMNGLFSIYDYSTLKSYHVFRAWGEMLALGNECATVCDVPDIYAASAAVGGESITMIAYYTNDDDAVKQTFTAELSDDRMRTVFLLDGEHDLTPVERIAPFEGRFSITMMPNTVIVLK